MKFALPKILLLCTHLVLSFAHDEDPPSNRNSSSPPSLEGLRFFSFWFMPDAPITLFQRTLIIPKGSTSPHTPGDVQAIWPGVEPDDGGAVLQNVVTNLGDAPGQWFFLPFYCCSPAKSLGDATEIHAEDGMTTILALDAEKRTWSNVWFDSPGTIRAQAGHGAFSGALSFELAKYPKQGPYHNAILTIELQGNATWDFGPVIWRNIIVEAVTKESGWCTKPVIAPGLNATFSTPSFSRNEGSTVCRIDSITFNAEARKQ